jgi:hypothetical protein
MAVMRREKACGRGKRAWQRNAVIAKALTPRPDSGSLARKPGRGCPLCGASSDHLRLDTSPAHLSQPMALTWLGIRCLRWSRNRLETVCGTCGSSFAGKAVMDWNAARARRRYADFGVVRFPLPHECRKRSLMEVLVAQLAPAKRKLINRQAARWMSTRHKKLARLSDWQAGWRGESIKEA